MRLLNIIQVVLIICFCSLAMGQLYLSLAGGSDLPEDGFALDATRQTSADLTSVPSASKTLSVSAAPLTGTRLPRVGSSGI